MAAPPDPGVESAGAASPGSATRWEPGTDLVPVQPELPPVTRHRAGSLPWRPRLRSGLLWPVAALAVVGLVEARLLSGTPLPDDGTLTAPAFALLRSEAGTGASAVSPDGMGALQTAVYATVTRAFDRHDTLVGAGREFLLVCVLVSALLLWRTSRRLGLSDPTSALVLLAFGALPVFVPVHLASTPSALAVPWMLLAAWLLAGGRPAPAAGAVAAIAALVAVLLAPDVLLAASAGLAAALATGALAASWSPGTRLAAALALAPLFVGVALLLDTWDPQPASPARWAASSGLLLSITVLLVALGLLGAFLLPTFRGPAVALAVTAGTAVAPSPGRLSALQVCLPLAALLLGALLQLAVRRALGPVRRSTRAPSRPMLLRPLQGLAALAIVGAAVVAVLGLRSAPDDDFGAAAQRAAIDWQQGQLGTDDVLMSTDGLWAELVHAGADPASTLTDDGTLDAGAAGAQTLQEAAASTAASSATASNGTASNGTASSGTGAGTSPTEPATGTPAPGTDAPAGSRLYALPDRGELPAGSQVVARFGSGAGTVRIVDPAPGVPSAAGQERRTALAGALLSNPTTAEAGQATGVLLSGDVDPRLLSLLAGIEAQFGVGLSGMPTVPGEEGTGTLTRQALLDSVDGQPLAGNRALLDRLQAWLAAQRAPFAPDTVTETADGLLLAYDYVPDPDALVDAATA